MPGVDELWRKWKGTVMNRWITSNFFNKWVMVGYVAGGEGKGRRGKCKKNCINDFWRDESLMLLHNDWGRGRGSSFVVVVTFFLYMRSIVKETWSTSNVWLGKEPLKLIRK